MKSYFLIGAKILGIYLFYLCLLNLFAFVAGLIVFASSPSRPFSILTMVSSTGSLVILLTLSILLLLKTDKVASILGVKEDQAVSKRVLNVQAGTILIGIFIFSTNIGGFLSMLYFQLKEVNAGMDPIGTMPKGLIFSKDLLTVTLTIIFSLFLIFGSKMIDKIIRPK
ncbi:MAG: hypothetical protein GY710_15340 [Desulfobacteraceae bacterium]|nr:hypothetical protein [Desulfobacteraceae bacterium]